MANMSRSVHWLMMVLGGVNVAATCAKADDAGNAVIPAHAVRTARTVQASHTDTPAAGLLLSSSDQLDATGDGEQNGRARDPRPSRDVTLTAAEIGDRLVRAYPQHLAGVDGGELIWRDGTRMRIDDGRLPKSAPDWLRQPDLKDMFRYRYPAGDAAVAPSADYDPGRARNAAFFEKMYGSCVKGDVAARLTTVAWLAMRSRRTVEMTVVNDVAGQLAKVVADLEALPAWSVKFLVPPGGTYSCRAVAGTAQASAHGYGIAIDIAVKPAHY